MRDKSTANIHLYRLLVLDFCFLVILPYFLV